MGGDKSRCERGSQEGGVVLKGDNGMAMMAAFITVAAALECTALELGIFVPPEAPHRPADRSDSSEQHGSV